MTDFIQNVAYMISESSDTPSYNDVMVVLKRVKKEPGDFTLSPEAYEKLSDDEKNEIFKYATQEHLSSDDEDLAFAYTQDIDKIMKWIEDGNRSMHHIDSEGFYRDNDGHPTVGPALADVMRKNGALDTFIARGGRVLKRGETALGGSKAFLFAIEKVWKYDSEKTKNDFDGKLNYKSHDVLSKIGTKEFNSKKEAEAEMNHRISEISSKFNLDRDKFKKLDAPHHIKSVDKNSYMLIYNEIEGEGKRIVKQRGPMPKGATERPDVITYDRPTFGYFIEYVVYEAKTVVKSSGDEFIKMLSGKAD